MADASRDQNNVPTLLGASSADGVTPIKVYANPTTHRLLVNATAGVTGPGTSVDNTVPRFNGTTGETLQGSGVTISDTDDLDVPGDLTAATVAVGNGANGTFTTADAKTVTVTDGIITSIV